MSRPRPGVVRRSSLCEGRVVHHRHGRPRHDFGYRVFLTLLDLDELPLLDRELRLFGYNRLRPVAFRDSDHLAASRRGVRADLVTAVEGAGHTMPDGRVELLTHCRILGYVFNPVSVFYCYDRNDRLTLAVAEVNNTYGDRHCYVLPVADPSFDGRSKKLMHVSPFFQPDVGSYRWEIPAPSERISLGMGTFDKIVSIEMFEALGREHWPVFFRKLDEVLAPQGLVALQAISLPDHRFEDYARHCDWIQRYIFPGSLLASLHHVTGAMSRVSRLGVHHLEDIGPHYALTLARWHGAFRSRLDEVRALGFDDRFIRMWDYYLAACQAYFATRRLGDLQLVLTRPGNFHIRDLPTRRAAAA